MADTNLKVLDQAMKTLAYTKFQTDLGLTSIDTDAVLYPKETARRIVAERRGKTSVGFLNVWRTGVRKNQKLMRTPLARRGLQLRYDDASAKTSVVMLKTMPVFLDYSIWFWDLDRNKIDAVIERAIFWQQVNPNLDLFYDAEETYPLNYDLLIGDIKDESQIVEQYNLGTIHVARLDLTLEGWVFAAEELVKAIHTVRMRYFDDAGNGSTSDDFLLFTLTEDLTG